MDDFERQLRDGFEQSRSSYEETPDPFARINQRAGRRQHRRRAVAAGCVVALIGVPIAVASVRDSSNRRLDAAPTWSARAHEESGASHVVTGAPQPTILANGAAPTPPPKGGSGGMSPGVVVPGATSSTVPGSSGSNPVTSAPSDDVTPNAVTPGGTQDGGSTADGTTGGGTTGGATPAVPELDGLAPSIGPGQTAATLATRGAPSCGGPSALAVGEEGVFTAPDRSAEPFSWAPSEPGSFDVVLDGPSGVVCKSAVSVGDDPDAGASDPAPPR